MSTDYIDARIVTDEQGETWLDIPAATVESGTAMAQAIAVAESQGWQPGDPSEDECFEAQDTGNGRVRILCLPVAQDAPQGEG